MFRYMSSLNAVIGGNARRPWTPRIGAAAGSEAAEARRPRTRPHI
ncbi:MAG: hypothetical protein QOK18_5033 [Mycobacterium sp.]|jgi:hypothetical protein|nr:hypothetical protein [Mycobacterium sp.]